MFRRLFFVGERRGKLLGNTGTAEFPINKLDGNILLTSQEILWELYPTKVGRLILTT